MSMLADCNVISQDHIFKIRRLSVACLTLISDALLRQTMIWIASLHLNFLCHRALCLVCTRFYNICLSCQNCNGIYLSNNESIQKFAIMSGLSSSTCKPLVQSWIGWSLVRINQSYVICLVVDGLLFISTHPSGNIFQTWLTNDQLLYLL